LYKASSRTRIIGNHLVYLKAVGSTNSWATELSKKAEIKDGTVFITDHQTAGRGQMGNRWNAEPHENLTFSVVLNEPVPLQEQFYLTVFVTLALYDFLATKVHHINIKWPNDILINQKKVAGILIENQVSGSRINVAVVGIGLNMNQLQFDLNTATSVRRETGIFQDLSAALDDLLNCLDERYLQLKSGKRDFLLNDWYTRLYLKDLPHQFSSGGQSFNGVITGVDMLGRLVVETAEGQRIFGFKEISY